MEQIKDAEAQVKKAVEKFKEELGKINVDIVAWHFAIDKTDKGITLEGTVKANITKK